MRICYFARANYALFQRRAASVAAQGHEVHVISLQPDEIIGCTVHHLSTNRLLQLVKGQYIGSLSEARHILRQIKPDLIDIHGVSSYGIYSLLAKKTPKVVTVYGPDLYDQAKRFLPMRLICQTAVQRADMVYGSTPAIADYVQDILNIVPDERFRIRSWGIPVKNITQQAESRRAAIRKEFGLSSETKVVLHSRQIAWMWRVPTIVDSIPAVLDKHPDTEFWFAYPPPNKTGNRMLNDLQQKAEELGIESKIRWLGFYPYDRLISIMHAADIFVCIGIDDLLASSVLEALATELVPVLSNLDAYTEIIEHKHNGYLISEVTVHSLTKIINFVLDNFDVIQSDFSKINRKLMAEKYDEDTEVKWLIEQYKSLVSTVQNGTNYGV